MIIFVFELLSVINVHMCHLSVTTTRVQLIRSTEHPAHEIKVSVAEHSTDTYSLNAVFKEIQRDTYRHIEGSIDF